MTIHHVKPLVKLPSNDKDWPSQHGMCLQKWWWKGWWCKCRICTIWCDMWLLSSSGMICHTMFCQVRKYVLLDYEYVKCYSRLRKLIAKQRICWVIIKSNEKDSIHALSFCRFLFCSLYNPCPIPSCLNNKKWKRDHIPESSNIGVTCLTLQTTSGYLTLSDEELSVDVPFSCLLHLHLLPPQPHHLWCPGWLSGCGGHSSPPAQ